VLGDLTGRHTSAHSFYLLAHIRPVKSTVKESSFLIIGAF